MVKTPGKMKTGLAMMLILFTFGLIAQELSLKPMPDLVVSSVKFEKVKKLQDSANHVYWIFNLNATITNLGKADAKKFKVLIDRNIGLNGSFQLACQTCWIDVPGLKAGDSIALDARQFNNANNFPSTFRVKADYPDNVKESNELNNMATATFVNFTMEGTR